jgi:NodT family efflux transporter outer membrane factor (OMF) lipoprotein
MKLRNSLSVAVTLAMTAGCVSVGSLPEASSIQLPARYAHAREPAAENQLALLLPQTDPAFGILTEQARRTAPSLGIALARIDAARAGLQRASANRLPTIEGSAGIAGNRTSTTQIATTGSRTTSRYTSGISANWDADLFGGVRASQRVAAARLEATTATAAAVRLALNCDIAVAIVDYRDSVIREAIVRTDLSDADDLLRLTRIRAKAGVVPGFDAVRAQSLLEDARTRLTPFGGEQANAIGRLVSLTALDAESVRAALKKESPVIAKPSPLPNFNAGVPSQLVRNRPDIQAAEFRLAAAKSDVAVAAAARFPRFSITSTLGLFAIAAGDFLNGDALNASLGAGVAGLLLDFGRIGADIKAREADAREAFETYRGTVFTALGEVEAALASYDSAHNSVEATARRVETDQDSLNLARERYRLGIADFLAVLDAQRTLNATRQARDISAAAKARAAIQLYRTLGGSRTTAGAL